MIVFNQAKVDASEIFSLVQVQSWTWLKNKVQRVVYFFFFWLGPKPIYLYYYDNKTLIVEWFEKLVLGSFCLAWQMCVLFLTRALIFSFLVWETLFSFDVVFCFVWRYFMRVGNFCALFWHVCFYHSVLRNVVWILFCIKIQTPIYISFIFIFIYCLFIKKKNLSNLPSKIVSFSLSWRLTMVKPFSLKGTHQLASIFLLVVLPNKYSFFFQTQHRHYFYLF